MNLEQMRKRQKEGKCPFCGKDMSNPSFRNAKSVKEFKISGMCQSCQDEMFGVD